MSDPYGMHVSTALVISLVTSLVQVCSRNDTVHSGLLAPATATLVQAPTGSVCNGLYAASPPLKAAAAGIAEVSTAVTAESI